MLIEDESSQTHVMLKKLLFFCLCMSGVNLLEVCHNSSTINRFIQKQEVTVVYLVNSSCVSCQNEVKKLRDLNNSLRKIGVVFQLIIALDKKQKVVYKNVQTNYGELWEGLKPHAYSNHVYIFDRCGRLTYEVVKPWSLIRKPYVKAAILSTFHDHPCGRCIQDLTTKFRENVLPMLPRIASHISSDTSGKENLPVDIVIMQEHRREGSERIHYYIERRVEYFTNNYEENNHSIYLEPDIDELFQDENFVLLHDSVEEENHFKMGYAVTKEPEKTEILDQIITESEFEDDVDYSQQSETEYYDENGSNDNSKSDDFVNTNLDSQETKKLPTIKEHYRQLFKWIKYDDEEEIW